MKSQWEHLLQNTKICADKPPPMMEDCFLPCGCLKGTCKGHQEKKNVDHSSKKY